MKICVLGLGYIGLPTASLFATQGHDVLGVDINPSVVETINRGGIHIHEPGLKTLVQAATLSGRLRAAHAPEPRDIFIIAVPTPCTARPDGTFGADLAAVRQATLSLCTVLAPGNLVILESTSPPGTTEHLVADLITQETGLRAGTDVFVAHCPERVLPGRILHELIHNDRVVGGVSPACAQRAADLYRTLIEGECLLTDAMTAEMVKLMENTYRDVNIALANELALIAEHLGFDANQVIDLANRHPRVHLHRPGPGVGGHCISVDPWFVYEAAPERARLIRTAREVNNARPHQVVALLDQRLHGLRDRAIAVLGVAYKGNVDDVRESPVTEIIHLLEQSGAQVRVYDPHVREYSRELLGLDPTLTGAHALLVGTAHSEFSYLDPEAVARRMEGRVAFDTVATLDAARWRAAGFTLFSVGRRDPA